MSTKILLENHYENELYKIGMWVLKIKEFFDLFYSSNSLLNLYLGLKFHSMHS